MVHPWEPAKAPWERIHLDFASTKMGKFLVCVDAFSKWPEVIPMKTTAAPYLVEVMTTLFARWGLPKKVFSDNGPEFVSDVFTAFLIKNGIKQKTAPVAHPASNGLAERHVQNVKKALKKMEGDPGSLVQKLSKFLLAYRNAAHSLTNETPAQLFLKRSLRTKLSLLQPDHEDVVEARNEKIVLKHKGTTSKVLEVGHNVLCKNFAKNGCSWVHGKIIAQEGSLTYIVQLGPNKYVKRHYDQLIALKGYVGKQNTKAENDGESHISVAGRPTGSAIPQSPVGRTQSPSSTYTNSADNSRNSDVSPEGEVGVSIHDHIEPQVTQNHNDALEVSERRRYPSRTRSAPRKLQDYDLELDITQDIT